MGAKRPFLLSLPMVSLYGACLGAVMLEWMRGRWGAAGWYPVAVGGVAAMAIIPLMGLAQRGLETGRRVQCVFFFVVGTGVLGVLPFLGRGDVVLICGVVGMSGVFLYAGVAVWMEWPGFRRAEDPDACPVCGGEDIGDDGVCARCGELVGPVCCPECGGDVMDNESGVCPECGEAIGDATGDAGRDPGRR